jgi:hypothetical protein
MNISICETASSRLNDGAADGGEIPADWLDKLWTQDIEGVIESWR